MNAPEWLAGRIQWLSENTLTVILACTVLAFLAEAWVRRNGSANEGGHRRSGTANNSRPRDFWSATWRLNAVLLLATLLISLVMAPLIEPALKAALRSNSGLLAMLDIPPLARLALGLVLLDFTVYALHWLAHRVGWLWRLHQVHHSDLAMNASTFFRQHPLTLIVTLVLQLPLVWLLGIPSASWVLYAIISAAVQIWHHSSTPAPAWLESAVGWLLVTPGLHERHHHPDRAVHDHNYGSVLSVWDRLFRTHLPASRRDVGANAARTTGLSYVQRADALSVTACLLAPFRSIKPAMVSVVSVSSQRTLKRRAGTDRHKPTPSPHRTIP